MVAARIACIGVIPRVDERAEFLGVLAVRDRRRVGAARDPHTGGNRFGQHGFCARKDLERFLAEFRCDAVDGHRVGQIGGRDQECAVVDHHLDGLVAGQETVLDAVDSGTDTGPNRAVADGMRGDPDSCPVGFVGDRGEFGIGVLLRARRGAVRHHPAGRRNLDQLGAVPNLVTHAGDHVGHSVGDAFGHRQRHDPGASRWNTVGSRCPP